MRGYRGYETYVYIIIKYMENHATWYDRCMHACKRTHTKACNEQNDRSAESFSSNRAFRARGSLIEIN